MLTNRPILPRVEAIVAQALSQHYVLRQCEVCGGPEVASRVRPAAKCLACGAFRTWEGAPIVQKRHRCERCRQVFWSVTAWTACPGCRDLDDRQERREAGRERKIAAKKSNDLPPKSALTGEGL